MKSSFRRIIPALLVVVVTVGLQRTAAQEKNSETEALKKAPQVSLGNLFFSRPVIRAYVTYAGWGDDFRSRVAGPDYSNRNYGWAFGMQIETWW